MRYFAHKRQNTIRPGQQVHADDLCIGVSSFECEGTESLTSAHIQDPKRAPRTGAQLADARARKELVLTEIGQLHLCELLKTRGKKRTGVLNHSLNNSRGFRRPHIIAVRRTSGINCGRELRVGSTVGLHFRRLISSGEAWLEPTARARTTPGGAEEL